MAKVTIFSTKGSTKKVHETNAKTWGELKNEISEFYDLSNLQATENVNRTDLVSDLAALPSGDFTLFLRPVKTKSGAYSYAEARSIIQNNPSLKEDIRRIYGKSYTNLSTEALNEALSMLLNGETTISTSSTEISNTETAVIDKEQFKQLLDIVLYGLENLALSVGISLNIHVSDEEDVNKVEKSNATEEDPEIRKLREEAKLLFGEI